MKRLFWLLIAAVLLCGCSMENRELVEAMQLRDRLLNSEGGTFQADVTADYGDELYDFSMDCRWDSTGKLFFEVTKPEGIAGIRGSIEETGGNLLFDEQALYFPLLTEDHLSPASAPWIFLKTLRGGYITAACREEELLRITVNDSFAEDALTLDIWLEEERPIRADILHAGKRILSLQVENFVIS